MSTEKETACRLSILKKILDLVSVESRLPVHRLTADKTFEALNFDSLSNIILVMEVEGEWDIEVKDDEAEQWKTPNDVAWYVFKALLKGEQSE